jgi:thiamine biosynthesis lipoprotein
MNRRHAITLIAAAAFTSCRRNPLLQTFSTIAFGTEVYFQTHGITETSFDDLSEQCSLRLRVIESLFSLYDPDSAISRLNRDGKLENPHPEFLKLVRRALDYGAETGGIFDITVQPLWDWRQKWKDADLGERHTMSKDSWEKALALVDYRNVKAETKAISLKKAGMAITLNAIVQGYATDEIISVFKKNGVANALVNIGEYAALGFAPDGATWKVELDASGEEIELPTGRALAVSAGSGHTFDPEGRFHHIFRPSDGANTRPKSTIVVTAPTATMADALSTTLSIATPDERKTLLRIFPEADFREIR